MNEAAVSAARIGAAGALRGLATELSAREVDDGVLAEIERQAEALRRLLETAPPRRRPEIDLGSAFSNRRCDGDVVDGPPDSLISGSANPFGWGIHCLVADGGVSARVCFGHAFAGPPDRVHGGVVAAVFDDLTRALLMTVGVPAFTAHLAVSYRAAVPLDADVAFRVGLRERDGRKLWAEGEATVDGALVAQLEALLVEVPIEALTGG